MNVSTSPIVGILEALDIDGFLVKFESGLAPILHAKRKRAARTLAERQAPKLAVLVAVHAACAAAAAIDLGHDPLALAAVDARFWLRHERHADYAAPVTITTKFMPSNSCVRCPGASDPCVSFDGARQVIVGMRSASPASSATSL